MVTIGQLGTLSKSAIGANAAALLPTLTALRRSIHAEPEVGLHLPLTRAALLGALSSLDLSIRLHERSSSFSVVVTGDAPGPVVLLRADMDALPIVEETELSFASPNGAMHACGHDMHAAALVGAVHIVHNARAQLAGRVIFMFQAGEEGHGGAQIMIDEGILEAAGEMPVAAYSIHVVPGPAGQFATRVGTLLAGGSELHITVSGSGGHSALAHLALDPVLPAAEIVLALESMVNDYFEESSPAVVTVTQFSASAAINVIPDEVRIGGSVRTLSRRATEIIERESTELARRISEARGCTATTVLDVTFPVTVNDPEETLRARDALADLFGADRLEWIEKPLMASEDFSHVLDRVPGAMFTLAASPAGPPGSDVAWNHSPRVLFDDELLADQAAALAYLALARLSPPHESPTESDLAHD